MRLAVTRFALTNIAAPHGRDEHTHRTNPSKTVRGESLVVTYLDAAALTCERASLEALLRMTLCFACFLEEYSVAFLKGPQSRTKKSLLSGYLLFQGPRNDCAAYIIFGVLWSRFFSSLLPLSPRRARCSKQARKQPPPPPWRPTIS